MYVCICRQGKPNHEKFGSTIFCNHIHSMSPKILVGGTKGVSRNFLRGERHVDRSSR